MMTRAEALALAQTVLDYKPKSYVEAARALASFVVATFDERYDRQEADALSQTQARCTELLQDRRELCRLILRAFPEDGSVPDAEHTGELVLTAKTMGSR